MVEITDQARLKIVELMEKSETGVLGLRLGAESVSPLKINFSLAFITDGQEKPDDTVIPFEGFDLYVDPDSAPNIEVAVVDYVDGLMGSGFKIREPEPGDTRALRSGHRENPARPRGPDQSGSGLTRRLCVPDRHQGQHRLLTARPARSTSCRCASGALPSR